MIATYPSPVTSPRLEGFEAFTHRTVLRQIEILTNQLLDWHRQRDVAEFENNHAQVQRCDRRIEYLDQLWEQYQAIADLLKQPSSVSDSSGASDRLRELFETVKSLESSRPALLSCQ